jgi:hypothetical protein
MYLRLNKQFLKESVTLGDGTVSLKFNVFYGSGKLRISNTGADCVRIFRTIC